VDSSFPEALREPVLRRVQFSTVSRIDNLVDQVFDDFRQDFYPGETVTVVLDDGTRLNGLVREKAKFPEIRRGDGSVERKAFSRYFVQLMTRSDEEALVDDDHIVRDRKAFTKQMLRSFIKNTVTREAWTGAPWLVKPKIAEEYRIDTQVPLHLQYGNKAAERKANAAAKKGEQEGMYQFWASRGLPELKPAIKGPKSKMTSDEIANMKHEQFQEYQRALQGNPTFVLPKASPPTFDLHQYGPTNGAPYSPLPHLIPKPFPKPPPPPPVKYPIEDLEVAPVRDGTHRPAIRYLSRDTPTNPTSHPDTPILMNTVGSLLETWNTLNVYCQVFLLDSFTFDDFIEAMQFSSAEVDCELFNEIHCAVLKKLVNGENDQNGAIQISLPDLPSDDEEDEDESNVDGSSVIPTPTPEPEEPVKRTTRSSWNKVEAKPAPRSRSATADIGIHRAAEMFDDYGWIQRLRKRDFRNGGWQLIMVGLLHQLAGRPRLQADCDEILTHLAPLDAEPTQQTAWLQYSTMDINMRVKALQIICMLTLETKAIKVFLEESSAQMTELRKIKIEHQRARKEA
jgi:DDT domain/ATP-utilising chromatin assembly and remodelling N-terminal/WSTF, HB1, Itc1p, MBD9 motif 1